MNIFVTSECPTKSAKYLDSVRCNKMILESAQMLSTALREHGYIGNDIYKATHKNHPSNKWCRESRSNYEWLLAHFKALAEEYYLRRGIWHKSYEKLYNTLLEGSKLIPEGDLTPFANCAANKQFNLDFKHIEDVTLAYKQYLDQRWLTDKRSPTWD